jgi:hypothetical protein
METISPVTFAYMLREHPILFNKSKVPDFYQIIPSERKEKLEALLNSKHKLVGT